MIPSWNDTMMEWSYHSMEWDHHGMIPSWNDNTIMEWYHHGMMIPSWNVDALTYYYDKTCLRFLQEIEWSVQDDFDIQLIKYNNNYLLLKIKFQTSYCVVLKSEIGSKFRSNNSDQKFRSNNLKILYFVAILKLYLNNVMFQFQKWLVWLIFSMDKKSR